MTEPDIDAIIQRGIISPEDLHALIQSPTYSPRLKILDGTFVLPGSEINPAHEFSGAHITGAQFFDIEAISDKNADLPHMLPPAPQFEEAVSAMGINNDDFIVAYGQSGLIMGPARVWWMFRYFGHSNICVLDGGLPAWTQAGYPISCKKEKRITPSSFKATEHKELLCIQEQIKQASSNKSAYILDARPAPRFNAETPEPRPDTRSGHIENSYNIPATTLIDTQTGRMKPMGELKAILAPYLDAEDGNIITTCGSGITACVIALALFNCGNKNACVYDGSWAEWGKK